MVSYGVKLIVDMLILLCACYFHADLSIDKISWNDMKHPEVFLAATKQLYKWYFPSVCPSVRLSVTPFWLCSHHRIIMKFSGVITNDQRKVHA